MNPQLLGLLLVIFVLVAFAGAVRRRRRVGAALEQPWPLEPKSTLLTEPEQQLYRRLVQALPQLLVLPQVQLLQAVRFKRGRWNAGILNRINRLSVDFLIVKPDTSIVAAVELDDASHDRQDRRAADARKAHALTSAGIPLIRWSVRQMPDAPAIVVALGRVTQPP
jgi:very-short-patch-repair endonuclease